MANPSASLKAGANSGVPKNAAGRQYLQMARIA